MKTFQIKQLADELPNGYRPFTTFYQDLSIADYFGADAVQDTYNRVMSEWKSNYKYITEFCICLNIKTWEHHESNQELAKLYTDLYYECRDWCLDNLQGEELDYYWKWTD